MSAPERIYLDGDAEAGDGYFTRCFETAKPCNEPAIEYVRADLCTPIDERVKRLEKWLEHERAVCEAAGDRAGVIAYTRARAALRDMGKA